MLQSPIGRVASQPMRNIETFPSKHMYLYLSLVERKVAEFYHNMVKMTFFHCFLRTIDGVLGAHIMPLAYKFFVGIDQKSTLIF